ncbi:hypothetical protein [Modestobacter versicolor]|uniref:hypothetical protein n=1 Tax=Modestobacter versicolor TaxID=429133 RepID=UPI0034E022B8
MRSRRRLAAARGLVAEETGRDPGGARIGIGLVGRRTYVVAALEGSLVLVPVRPVLPVRRLPDAPSVTFPAGTVDVVRRRGALGYRAFDLVAPGGRQRLLVARLWTDLVGDLDERAGRRRD